MKMMKIKLTNKKDILVLKKMSKAERKELQEELNKEFKIKQKQIKDKNDKIEADKQKKRGELGNVI